MMNVSLEELTGLNGAFGPLAGGSCRVSLKGDVAVRTEKGYRAFDPATKKLVNVTDFCLDFTQLFYIWPTKKLAVGDVVFFDGRFKCVTEVLEGSVKALDYANAIIEELVPEQRLFFGKKYYGKVTNLLGTKLKDSSKLMKMSLMMQALGGSTAASGNTLLPLLMLNGGIKDAEEGADEGEGLMKTFLLTKVMVGNGGDGNSMLPLLLLGGLGKGEGSDGIGLAKMLFLAQAMGGQQAGGMDLGKLLLFQSLGEGGADDLFGSLAD